MKPGAFKLYVTAGFNLCSRPTGVGQVPKLELAHALPVLLPRPALRALQHLALLVLRRGV
jgi:hypothetical protein